MMAHKRRYKEHVLDDLRQPSKATKYRRITESEVKKKKNSARFNDNVLLLFLRLTVHCLLQNYFKCRDRGSYKKYLNCPSSHKEKRRVSTEVCNIMSFDKNSYGYVYQ